MRRSAPLVALLAIVAGVVTSAAPAEAAFPGANGKMVFMATRDGNYEIYRMNDDGSEQERLTSDTGIDQVPTWSPDGSQIAFYSNRDGNYEIYKMNADGSGQARLTVVAADDRAADWSPDGTMIAFDSIRDGNREVYKMDADGNGQTRLTTNAAVDCCPVWSPDGSTIVFCSNRDGNDEIYTMDTIGGSLVNLTTTAAHDCEPDWSPDGTQIVFRSNRVSLGNPEGDFEIFTMDAAGTNQAQITSNAALDDVPGWSPDGTQIAFHSNRDSGNYEIYKMDANGSSPMRLTTDVGVDVIVDWQPCPAAPDSDGFKDCPKFDHEASSNTDADVDNCLGVANAGQLNADGNFIDLTPPKANDDLSWVNSDNDGDDCDDDDDNDGLADAAEAIGCNGSGALDPLLRDTDGDRYLDNAECVIGTNPADATNKPTQALCVMESGAAFASTDTDGDGVKDYVEYCHYNSDKTLTNTDGTSEFPLSSPPPGPLVAYCSDGREVASVDNNRTVNAADLGLVASAFGGYTAPPAPGTEWKMDMDFDKNGTINAADLGLVASKFGACP